jgi:SAM-dependent methyltransferase
MTGPPPQILDQVARYYATKLASHGPTARGVDWNNSASHLLRHQQFLRLLGEDKRASVIDLGCGYGDFLPFLRERGFSGDFIGYDISPEMIAAARHLQGEAQNRTWRVGSNPSESAEFAVASGILNVKGPTPLAEWIDHVHDTIEILARAGRRGFAFNVLTQMGDPALRKPNLYYADPVKMLTYCLNRFGRSVSLLQDYKLWEFTVLVRRDD